MNEAALFLDKVINFICMLDVLHLYYDNSNMSFFCLSENYKNFPFHLKTAFFMFLDQADLNILKY